jgi:hypothetical protein
MYTTGDGKNGGGEGKTPAAVPGQDELFEN